MAEGLIKSLYGTCVNGIEYLEARAANALEKARNSDKAMQDGRPDKATPFPMISLVGDPDVTQHEARYYERFTFINNDTLKLVAYRDVIISAIIARRIAQITKGSRIARKKYDIGFKIELKENERPLSEEQEMELQFKIENFILNCGEMDEYRKPTEYMSFEEWLRRTVSDLMIFDAMSTELIPTMGGDLYAFRAIDAGTIRRARRKGINPINLDQAKVSASEPEAEEERVEGMKERLEAEGADSDTIMYMQLINNNPTAYYTYDDLIYRTLNPINDVRLNGYSISPIEKLISIVTSHMSAELHNRAYFCCSPDSLIKVENGGQIGIGDAFDKYGENTIKIWTGTQFHDGHVLKTRQLEECETHLASGQIIRTSDEHWFWAIKAGEVYPRYINQRDLQKGDLLLVDPSGYESDGDCPRKKYNTNMPESHPLYKEWDSSPVEEDMFEVLGWLSGDGHIGAVDNVGREGPVQLFYHYIKELDIADRHLKILQKYGVNCLLKHKRLSKNNIEKHGHETSLRIFIHDAAFKRWLIDLGFGRSTAKGIPTVVLNMPKSYREAFIRGLFSADGFIHKNKHGYATPCLASKSDLIRSGAASILNSLGVSCTLVEKTRHDNKETVGLRIQDVERFKTIGFIQDYKNQFECRGGNSNADRYDLITPELSREIAKSVIDRVPTYVGDHQRNSTRNCLNKILRSDVCLTRKKAFELAAQYGLDNLVDLLSFKMIPVFDNVKTGNVIQMYDVEIFDPIHRFTIDGVVTHNTQGFSTRGVLSIKGNIPQPQLEAFRRQWYTQISSASNSWRTPIIGGQDIDLQWVPLTMNNRDMEWDSWMHYLVKCICSIYLIAPQEIGWETGVSTGTVTGDSGKRNMILLQESKDVGLDPLIRFIENVINERILPKLYGGLGARYVFKFSGFGTDNPTEDIEREVRQLTNYKKLDEVRTHMGLEPVGPPLGDMILNPVLIPFYEAMLFGPPEQKGNKSNDAKAATQEDERETRSSKKKTREAKNKAK